MMKRFGIWFVVLVFGAGMAAQAQPEETPLQQALDELTVGFEKKAPVEVKADFQKGIEEVRASGVLDRALGEGAVAPDFTLPDVGGGDVTLSDFLKKGPVVLVWYRGGWCPYCSLHLRALQDSLPEFNAAKATLIAISPDLPDKSLATKQGNELGFHVLSDKGNEVAAAYGLVYPLPDSVMQHFNTESFDLAKHTGDGTYTLPIAASYVIGKDGVIQYAFVDADYRNRPDPEILLEAVKQLA